MRVIVCGGRSYADRDEVVRQLRGLREDAIIVHGAATGADALAEDVAQELGYMTERWPAEWAQGRKAGPLRNAAMVKAGASLVIAFPGGRGTADLVARARAAGIPVREVDRLLEEGRR
jgi:hypothetical protein